MSPTDQPTELAAKVTAALDRLARARRAEGQTLATRHGLSPLQVDLLTTLAAGTPPEPSVGALATELAISQPTVTDSVRALIAKGLVARRPNRDDGRRATLELTAAGHRLAVTLASPAGGTTAAVAAMAPSAQAATLETLLALIAQLVDAGVIDVARTCLTCRFHRHDGEGHHCTLLARDLPAADLRVNCPDHTAA